MSSIVKERTVLVTEDETDVMKFVSRVLELEGYKVLQAADGDASLSVLKAFPMSQIDLVLLDLKLPKRDGWSVLSEMRGDPRLRQVPVIVFTASSSASEKEHAWMMGADVYLVKPLSARTLVENVKSVLNRQR